ncbi:uncharacterized protein LOC141898119 [Tubulanus polymorphus]|uniref:uncharacterized protein LOC141898119 n=1 Tax=Tubulanus polymorphus TaxID=672921 RepID=UPI003DA56855
MWFLLQVLDLIPSVAYAASSTTPSTTTTATTTATKAKVAQQVPPSASAPDEGFFTQEVITGFGIGAGFIAALLIICCLLRYCCGQDSDVFGDKKAKPKNRIAPG